MTAGGGQGAARAMEDLPEIRVNAKLREYLSVDVPPREKVVSYLTNIGEVYAPDWKPSVTAKREPWPAFTVPISDVCAVVFFGRTSC